jgi:hypothetical protein
MMRSVVTVLLCAVAIVAGDALFRRSLLDRVRPIIVLPSEAEVVTPPVRVHWQGPPRMQVLLSLAGEEARDFGLQTAPFTLNGAEFPRDGGYRLELRGERFGGWIRASRWFQVHTAPPPAAPPPPVDAQRPGRDLLRALEVVRAARDKAQARSKFLRQENSALQEESERLAKQLEALYGAQEEEAERTRELERRLAQLAEENRALLDENGGLRQRLGSIVPCSVWGYYSFPRPQTIPLTRRVLTVTDPRGRILRAQMDCELVRRDDVTAGSVCFCVGSSWGG